MGQSRRNGPGTAPAQGFLILPEGQQQRARRPEGGAEQVLHGFELGEYAGFVVEGAAAVKVAVGLRAGKGRPGPLGGGGGQHGHHVVVAQQQHGLQGRVGASPGEEQAVLVEFFELELGKNLRKCLPQVATKAAELGRIGLGKVGGGYGGNAHCPRQACQRRIGNRHGRRGRHCPQLVRGQPQGIGHQHQQQQ